MTDFRTEAPTPVKDFLRFEKTNHDLRDKTLQEYYLDLRVFFRFMKQERGIAPPDVAFNEIDISDITLDFVKGITKQDINNYISYLRADREVSVGGTQGTKYGLESVSAKRKIVALRSFFHYLTVDTEVLDKDPSLSVTMPVIRNTLPTYLTEEESVALLNGIDGKFAERDYTIILLALSCGLRVSEIVGINLTDIHFIENGNVAYLLVRGKGGKQREVFLPANCVDAINAYMATRDEENAKEEDKDALFLSQKHCRIGSRAVQHLLDRATLQAGVRKISPHKLRHTAATMMMSHGTDIRTLQELLGHANIQTTQIYTHITGGDIREASEKSNPMAKYNRPRIEDIVPDQEEKKSVLASEVLNDGKEH